MKNFLENEKIYMLKMDGKLYTYENIEPEKISWVDDNTFECNGNTYKKEYHGEFSGYVLSCKEKPRLYVKVDTYDFLAG